MLRDAGLVQVFVDEGHEAYRLTAAGVRVGHMLALCGAVLAALLNWAHVCKVRGLLPV
jgi:hypothetical protein